MSDLDQSIKQLITALKNEAEEINTELKDISSKVDKELIVQSNTSSDHV